MRLEPVSERTAQHACGRSRRATLHHVVLAVKEIRRIARVKRHWRKARKRRELCSRPLPSVPYKIVHTESARTREVCSYWRKIPGMKIEVSSAVIGFFFAPRIAALHRAIRCSVGGPMKLRFCREFSPQPFRIGGSLGVTHVNRPFLRQTNLPEHRAVHPEVSVAPPECWMLDPFLLLPRPGFVTPQRTVLVATGLDKSQKIAVRHVVIVDGEFPDLHLMCAKFVVPAEFVFHRTLQTKRHPPRGNVHQVRLHSGRLPCSSLRQANLPVARQHVQHVRERLRMYQAMLDCHVQHRDQLGVSLLRPRQRAFESAIQLLAHSPVVALDLLALRPIRGRVRRQPAIRWVNSISKKLIEGSMK